MTARIRNVAAPYMPGGDTIDLTKTIVMTMRYGTRPSVERQARWRREISAVATPEVTVAVAVADEFAGCRALRPPTRAHQLPTSCLRCSTASEPHGRPLPPPTSGTVRSVHGEAGRAPGGCCLM